MRMFTTDRKPVEVPDDQVMQAFLNGHAGFAQGERVPVVAPDGTPGRLDASEAAEAFRSGWTFDPKTVQAVELQQKHGGVGQQVLTAAESALSGATLGLSTLAETKLLGVNPEDIRGRQEANPITSGTAHVAGAIAPLLISGGTSAPAQATVEGAGLLARGAGLATKALTAPMRALTAAGKGTEALARTLLPKGAGATAKAIAATIPPAAGSAVEGSLFSLGQLVDETALHREGDPELTAEHVLSVLGTGALVGAGAGLGTKAIAEGAARIPGRERAGNALRRLFGGNAAKAREAEDLLLRQAREEELAAGISGSGADLTADVTGTGTIEGTLRRAAAAKPNAEGIAKGITAPGLARAEGENSAASRQVLAAWTRTGAPLDGALPIITRSRALQGTWDALSRNPKTADPMRKASEKSFGGLETWWNGKLKEVGNATATREAAGGAAQNAARGVASKVSKTQDGLESAWQTAMGGGETRIGMENARGLLEEMKVRASPGGTRPDTTLFPKEFQNLLERIDAGSNAGTLPLDYVRSLRTAVGEGGGMHTILPSAAPELERLYGALTRDMEAAAANQGERAVGLWRAAQDHWRNWAQLRESLRSLDKAPDGLAAFNAIFTRDRAGLTRLRVLKQVLPDDEFSNLMAVYLRELSTDAKTGRLNLSQWQRNWSSLPSELRDAVVDQGHSVRQAVDDLTTISRAAQDSSFMKNFSNTASAQLFQEQITGGGTQAIVDAINTPQTLTGAITYAGRVAGQALKRRVALAEEDMARVMTDPESIRWAFTNPTAQRLANLERAIQSNENRLQRALGKLTDSPLLTRTPVVAAAVEPFRRRNETPLQAYQRRWNQLRELDVDPEKLVNRMMAATGDLPDAAPETSFLMQAKAAQVVQFLSEKAPKNPNGVDDPFFGRPWVPRDEDIQRWGRYWEAASDPLGVIEAMAKGRISREGVETLRTVFPKLYELTKRTLLEQLAAGAEKRENPLPYEARLQLSTLFQEPLDAGLQPQAIAAAQARFRKPQAGQAGQGAAGAQGGPEGAPGTKPGAPVRRVSKLRSTEDTATATQRLASRG